jgi:hypothetical protein
MGRASTQMKARRGRNSQRRTAEAPIVEHGPLARGLRRRADPMIRSPVGVLILINASCPKNSNFD